MTTTTPRHRRTTTPDTPPEITQRSALYPSPDDDPVAWGDLRGRTGAAFTMRRAGVSVGPYASLNLGGHVGDDPDAVRENRSRLAGGLGLAPDRLLFAEQVHGTAVEVVDGPWSGAVPQADALVTRTPGLAVGVLVADCVPVVLRAPDEGIVAVAHAGRRGTADGVVPAVLAVMRTLGAGRLDARVGPSVCGRCYEVPAEMRDDVAARVAVAASVTRTGTPSLDLAAGVAAQLAAGGASVDVLPGCTAELPTFFSYRRDGVTGRFAGVAWVDGP